MCIVVLATAAFRCRDCIDFIFVQGLRFNATKEKKTADLGDHSSSCILPVCHLQPSPDAEYFLFSYSNKASLLIQEAPAHQLSRCRDVG